jgi:hypothetical protein
MRITLPYGRQALELEIADSQWIPRHDLPSGLPDPAAAVRAALEQPHGFPPLRRALTPDDHVTVVLDERLPRLVQLLVPLLEHVVAARVEPERITLLCPSSSPQAWLEDLPDAFAEAHLEVHDPADRKRLSYLATSSKGKRLYLNRTVVDADQIVVLSGRRYDPLLGYGGAEGALGPLLGDEQTLGELNSRMNLGVPGATPWQTQVEANETAWLLGAPFFVQVIEGPGDEIAHVIAGTVEASREGQRLLDQCWRHTVSRPADLVIASLSGDPARHTFADFAAALACAARVVVPNGRIVLLTQAGPPLGPGADLLRQAVDPQTLLNELRDRQTLDLAPVFQWANAAQQARINLLCEWPDEVVEDLFATPLQHAGQVQRLLAAGLCLLLPDAHKTLAVVEEG